MGIGIEFQEFCIELKKYGAEERVDISFCTGDLWSLSCSHAEFRAACCRGLGLVDPNDAPYPISQDDVDELCRKRMADKRGVV